MEAILPALCAALVVAGVIAFIVYCMKAINAEARRVENWRP